MKSFQKIRTINRQEHNWKSFSEKNPQTNTPTTFLEKNEENKAEAIDYDELAHMLDRKYGIRSGVTSDSEFKYYYSLKFFTQANECIVVIANLSADDIHVIGKSRDRIGREIELRLKRDDFNDYDILHRLQYEYVQSGISNHDNLKPAFNALCENFKKNFNDAFFEQLKNSLQKQEEGEMFDFRKSVKDSEKTKAEISELERAIREKDKGTKLTWKTAGKMLGKKLLAHIPMMTAYTLFGLYIGYVFVTFPNLQTFSISDYLDFATMQKPSAYGFAYVIGFLGYHIAMLLLPREIRDSFERIKNQHNKNYRR